MNNIPSLNVVVVFFQLSFFYRTIIFTCSFWCFLCFWWDFFLFSWPHTHISMSIIFFFVCSLWTPVKKCLWPRSQLSWTLSCCNILTTFKYLKEWISEWTWMGFFCLLLWCNNCCFYMATSAWVLGLVFFLGPKCHHTLLLYSPKHFFSIINTLLPFWFIFSPFGGWLKKKIYLTWSRNKNCFLPLFFYWPSIS